MRHWQLLASMTVLACTVSFSLCAATFNVDTATEFQTALDTAATNGEDDVINLAAGIYSASSNGNQPFSYVIRPDCNSAAVADSLTITGAGTGNTVLDGASSQQVLHVRHDRFGPLCFDQPVNGTEIANDNDDSQATITVEGLTIQNGQIVAIPGQRDTTGSNCAFEDFSELAGGMALKVYRSEIIVQNNHFVGNVGNEGGGMRIDRECGSASVTVADNLFSGNATDPYDDADFWYDPATCEIFASDTGGLTQGPAIGDDRAQSGGGAMISARDGRVALTDNVFTGNVANVSADGANFIYGVDGGGLSGKGVFSLGEPGANNAPTCPNSDSPWAVEVDYDPDWGTNPANPATILVGGSVWDIERNLFASNAASGGDGGGAHLWGNMHLADNQFIGNSTQVVSGREFDDALDGGGLHIFTKGVLETPVLTRNLYQGNSAEGEGGGLQLRSPRDRVDVTASIFSGNESKGHARGTNERHVSQGGGGGAYLFTDDGTLNFVNNSVCANVADAGYIADRPRAVGNGGGVVIYAQLSDDAHGTTTGGPYDLPAVANIYNNIIWGNTADPDTGSGDDLFIEDLHAGSNQNYYFGPDPITDNEGSEINLFNNNYGDLAHLCEDDPACTADLSSGDNTSLDPQFANLGECRFNSTSPMTAAVGFPNAPGMPSVDFDGNPIDPGNPLLGAVIALADLLFWDRFEG